MKREITKSVDELLGHFLENSSYLKYMVLILILFAIIFALGKAMRVVGVTGLKRSAVVGSATFEPPCKL